MSELLSDCSELASRLIKYIRAYRFSLFSEEQQAVIPQIRSSSRRRGSKEDSEIAKKKSTYIYCSIFEIFKDSDGIVDTQVLDLFKYLCNFNSLLTSCCLQFE